MATSVGLSGIAPKAGEGWKPEVWDIVEGEILYVGTSIGDSYDRKRKEMELRVDLMQPSGVKITVWATMETDIDPNTNEPTANSYPKRDARAIASAVQATTGPPDIEIGGYLKMQRVADEPTDFGDAKTFIAEYRRPRPTAGKVGLPPVDTPTEPARPRPQGFQAPPPAPQGFQASPPPAPVSTAGPALLDWVAAVTGTPRHVLELMTTEQVAQLAASLQPSPPAPVPQGNPLGSLMAPRPQ
jgi:hypothetical protein